MPMQHFTTLLGADTAFLLSPIKPLLMAVTFLPWAWLISEKLDKDAQYFHLPRVMWNSIHLLAGALAVIAFLFIPIFWIGWPVAIIALLTPILIYWKVRNDSVPENKRFYLTTESIAERMERRRLAAASRGALVNFTDASGKRREVPLKEDPVFQIHLIAEDLMGPAVEARASRVEMAPGSGGYVVTQVIDGVKYSRNPVATDAGTSLIDYLKDIGGLDVQNRRRRQVGDFRMNGPGGTKTVSITTAGSSTGQEMRLEFDRADRLNKPFDDLGLLPNQLEALRKFESAENRHGIILIGAPAGHGLSTTGYSILGRHDAYTTNVKSLEREIMLRHDGVDHQKFDSDNPDLEFAIQLQSMLRRDPDVLLVGDITDKDTARIAAEPGIEGPLIYIPQRLPGVREQIVDWVKRVGDIKKAVKPLRVAMNQRLLRSLCPNCRQAYRPSAEQIKKLNLPPDKVQALYKASGKVQVKNRIENCPVCQGTGYFGQAGVFEVMVLDDAARKLIINNDLQGAYTHCRRNGMIFMQEAALKKVVQGMTTLEEVARVIAPARPQQSPPPRPQPASA